MRKLLLVVAGTCVLPITACERGTPSAANRERAEQVSGSWNAELTLDRLPVLLPDSAVQARTLRGRFAFVPSSARNRTDSSPAAYGVYDVDFAALRLPRPRGAPDAVLFARADDSVEIRLDPKYDETIIVLRGRIVGDSIRGTWDVSVPHVTQGRGTFTMTRRLERKSQ